MTDPGPGEDRVTPPGEPATHDSDAARVVRLGAYFRDNRGRFTGEALKRAAAAAGYSARDIDAAWGATGWDSAEAPAHPQPAPQSGFVTAAAAVLFVVGFYGTFALLGSNPSLSGGIAPAALLGLVGGLVAWAALRESNPALARGIGCGVVIVVVLPIVAILTFLGLCLVTGTLPLNRP